MAAQDQNPIPRYLHIRFTRRKFFTRVVQILNIYLICPNPVRLKILYFMEKLHMVHPINTPIFINLHIFWNFFIFQK